MKKKAFLLLIGFVVGFALALVLTSPCRRPPDPDTVVVIDSVLVPGPDGEPIWVTDTVIDPRLSREINRLRAELDGKATLAERLAKETQQQSGTIGYLREELDRARLKDTLWMVYEARVRPGRIDWVAHRGGFVQAEEFRTWRRRVNVRAGRGGLDFTTSRIPFECDFVAGVRADWTLGRAIADSTYWPGGYEARVGLEFRRGRLETGFGWRQLLTEPLNTGGPYADLRFRGPLF